MDQSCKYLTCNKKKNLLPDGFCKQHSDKEKDKCNKVGISACGICKKSCTKEAVQCDRCNIWYHYKCTDISEETHEYLNAILSESSINWFCKLCEPKVSLLLINDHTFDKVNAQITELTNEINKMKEVNEKLSNVGGSIADTIACDLSEKMSLSTNTKDSSDSCGSTSSSGNVWMDNIKRNAKYVAKEAIVEMDKVYKEREAREKNILIFRAPEQTSESADKRKEEDEKYFLELATSQLEIKTGSIYAEKLQRLGRVQSDKDRPLKVTFKSVFDKRRFMSRVYKLKEADEKFSGVSIADDLTPEDREVRKRLVLQAKAKNLEEQSSEYVWKVRGAPWDLHMKRLKIR